MAIIQVHQFTSNAGVTYTINYDDSAGSVSTQFSGGIQEATVTAAELGYNEGNIMYSQCEGNDYVKILADLDFPFATRSVDVNSPTCASGGCDLIITSLVTTAETANNADDGAVTATATSSNTGIEYSLDGVTWQSSGLFMNLSTGIYSMNVRDSGSCTVGQLFVIEMFDNPLVQGPERELSMGNVSTWNAAFNPINFVYQRRDLIVENVTDGGNGTIIVHVHTSVSGADYDQIMAKGLYLKTEHYGYTGLPIDDVLPHDQYKIPLPFTVADNDGFVISDVLKSNYKVNTEVSTSKGTVVAEHTPDAKGKTIADISYYLRSLLSVNDDSKYDKIIYTDNGLSIGYRVRYRATWDGFTSDWFSSPNLYHATFAAMQLQEHGGGNMMDYTTFIDENNPSKLAGWLTDFTEPVYFLGLPFDVSFILNDGLTMEAIHAEYTVLDINRNPVPGGITGSFLLNENGSYLLKEDGGKFLIDLNDAVSGTEQISPATGINRLMLPSGFLPTVDHLTVQLFRDEGTGKKYITKKLTVRIVRQCTDPFVYLKWINHLGAWDYYRFGASQLKSFNTVHTTIIKRPVLDWANNDTINDLVSSSAFDSIEMGADGIPGTNIDALNWLRKSIKVQLLSSPNPYRWKTVIVQPGRFIVGETRNRYFDVGLTVTLPETNIQQQ